MRVRVTGRVRRVRVRARVRRAKVPHARGGDGEDGRDGGQGPGYRVRAGLGCSTSAGWQV